MDIELDQPFFHFLRHQYLVCLLNVSQPLKTFRQIGLSVAMMLRLYRKKIGKTWFAAALDGKKIVMTNFAGDDKDALQPILKGLPYGLPFETMEKSDATAEELFKVMSDILEGRDVSFKFEFDLNRLPQAMRKVLEIMSLIPTGYVTTYGELARVAETGPRVAGRACATNPFAPLVPCHRVVASDLSLHGYAGGLDLKWRILHKEDRGYTETSKVKLKGKELSLFPINQLRQPRKNKN